MIFSSIAMIKINKRQQLAHFQRTKNFPHLFCILYVYLCDEEQYFSFFVHEWVESELGRMRRGFPKIQKDKNMFYGFHYCFLTFFNSG